LKASEELVRRVFPQDGQAPKVEGAAEPAKPGDAVPKQDERVGSRTETDPDKLKAAIADQRNPAERLNAGARLVELYGKDGHASFEHKNSKYGVQVSQVENAKGEKFDHVSITKAGKDGRPVPVIDGLASNNSKGDPTLEAAAHKDPKAELPARSRLSGAAPAATVDGEPASVEPSVTRGQGHDATRGLHGLVQRVGEGQPLRDAASGVPIRTDQPRVENVAFHRAVDPIDGIASNNGTGDPVEKAQNKHPKAEPATRTAARPDRSQVSALDGSVPGSSDPLGQGQAAKRDLSQLARRAQSEGQTEEQLLQALTPGQVQDDQPKVENVALHGGAQPKETPRASHLQGTAQELQLRQIQNGLGIVGQSGQMFASVI